MAVSEVLRSSIASPSLTASVRSCHGESLQLREATCVLDCKSRQFKAEGYGFDLSPAKAGSCNRTKARHGMQKLHLHSLRGPFRNRKCPNQSLSSFQTSLHSSSRKSTSIVCAGGIKAPNAQWEVAFETACDKSDLRGALQLLKALSPPKDRNLAEETPRPSAVTIDLDPQIQNQSQLQTSSEDLQSQGSATQVLVQEPDFEKDAIFDLPLQSEAESSADAVLIPSRVLLRVLDACLGTTDLFSVAAAYGWLQQRGLLRAFGKVKLSEADTSRVVTPEGFLRESGLEASKLSPKKSLLQGPSAAAFIAVIAALSYANTNELTFVRPVLTVGLGLGFLDSIWLGGAGFGQVMMTLWPGHKRRVLVHEAGHVVAAYLLGCPVRGVVLDAVQAVKLGIRGQAGTQFWDQKLEEEMQNNKLSVSTLDRYFVVLFAGIAAEAIIYGEAEGGDSDERLYVHVVKGLRPPWNPAKISNQARWSVLQAYKLLQSHERVLTAVVRRLESGASMADIARVIEESAERRPGLVQRIEL